MTGGDAGLWSSLSIFVLSLLIGVGGVLKAISGESYGWRVVGVTVAIHFFNCIGLTVYCLH
jgi:hypothetical protein